MGAPTNVTTGSTGGGAVNDVFNRDSNKYISSFDQPFSLNTSVNYTDAVDLMEQGCVMGAARLDHWSLCVLCERITYYGSGLLRTT
jgi:hypothetical protein